MQPDDDIMRGDEQGGARPIYLNRSEIQILRRQADRWPINKQDRQDLIDNLMEMVCNAKSSRVRIMAARTVLAADMVNLREVSLLLNAEKSGSAAIQPAPQHTVVNVNVTTLTLPDLVEMAENGQALPREALDKLSREDVMDLYRRIIG